MNKITSIITLMMICLFCSQGSDAASLTTFDAADAAMLASVKSVKIIITDDVTGGCLPNPNGLKDKMEIVLRKNGFSVADEDKHADAIVHISAVGMKTGSSCAAHVRTSVMFTTLSLLPKSEYVQSGTTALVFNEISIASMILTGGFMQQRLAQAVEEHADKLSLKILRAREFQFEYR